MVAEASVARWLEEELALVRRMRAVVERGNEILADHAQRDVADIGCVHRLSPSVPVNRRFLMTAASRYPSELVARTRSFLKVPLSSIVSFNSDGSFGRSGRQATLVNPETPATLKASTR